MSTEVPPEASRLEDLPRPVKTYHSETYDRIAPAKTKFDGKDKVVLITGGATGIGFSIAQSFAEAGVFKIIIVSRSPGPQAEAKEELGAKFPNVEVVLCQASMTDYGRMVEIQDEFGPVDVLVLSAAASHPFLPALDLPSSEVLDTVLTNVNANYHILRHYLGQPSPAAGSKTVINVSSCSSHMTIPGQTGYGPSKAAFTQMITQLASQITPQKDSVRMFSYHPGALYTPTVRKLGMTEDALKWEDIRLPGHFAVWLASPESDFLHGKFVWAAWDVDELVELKGRVEKDASFLTIGLVQ
ncbi:Hypothetical predicted protein [Lecanosticta acicola]|uniref:Ketoreductase domain-containing protein n=1 Tax=Lecanosticta acicola TaxID=111012 RepID=A0AAI9EEF3_9PEZI|nr:Hypothetical predicted protein [Lecanosticta acicola]